MNNSHSMMTLPMEAKVLYMKEYPLKQRNEFSVKLWPPLFVPGFIWGIGLTGNAY